MGIDQARAGLAEWASGGNESVYSMAAEFGASRESVEADPLSILPRWNDFISRLPLDEFDDDDWFWLQSQVAAYLAFVLIRVHGGRWDVVPDEASPDRFVYVVAVTGWDGRERNVDLLDLVYLDLAERPPVVTRMLGNAEVAAGVTIPDA